MLVGRRRVGLDRIEQRLDSEIARRRRTDKREDPASRNRSPQSLFQLGLRQSAGFKEPLHQCIIGFGHHFDQRFPRAARGVHHVLRDLGVRWRPAAISSEAHRLHGDQVDKTRERLLLTDRKLNRDDLAAAGFAERGERPFEARPVAVETVQDHEAREFEFFGDRPDLLGLHLDAGDGIDHQHGGIDDAHGRSGVAQEVRHPGSIDHIDLDLVPLRKRDAGR